MKRSTEQLNWDISKIVYDHVIKDNTINVYKQGGKIKIVGKALIFAFPLFWGTDRILTFMQFLIESALNLKYGKNSQVLKQELKFLST